MVQKCKSSLSSSWGLVGCDTT